MRNKNICFIRNIRKVKKWKIHLIHHTHFDIGYTHTQQEVLDIQFQNQETAMDLVDVNRQRPENAQFRWNPEATWALKEWLKQAGKPQIERFISMVQSGHIGLDALFANMHTALCRPEELVRMMDRKEELEKLTGVAIDSAMISDVPGWNWGMVSALSERGIRYLSAGTNTFDRIGYTIKEWGDKPFYWISPSGREKILLWVHGKGYSWFHPGLSKYFTTGSKLRYTRIRRYLNSLENENYPYDTVLIRYNIGGDNGPPDTNLSSIVEEWNKKHDDIELIISTTSSAMKDFEEKYGNDLAEYRGDFTAYWEDGALSTARETALARNAAERITLADRVSVLSGTSPDRDLRERAWESVLLFNEHTWGAHNSITRPDHPFAKSQWEWKRQHAVQAEKRSIELLTHSIGKMEKENSEEISLYNAHSWPVSRIVELETNFHGVCDDRGKAVPAQKLVNGKLAFFAENVPPMGSRSYKLTNEIHNGPSGGDCRIIEGDEIILENDTVSVRVERKSGIITSLSYGNRELIDKNREEHFNAYVRIPGKVISLKKTEKDSSPVQVEIIEKGPLVGALRISRKAPACHAFVTEITLHAGSEEVFISNTLDRPVKRSKEGIHFAFPLNIPGGRLFYDTAWGLAEADVDQLPGANRNVLYASRRIDVAGDGVGVSCTLIDTPAIKTGKLIHDPVRSGPAKLCGWLEKNPFDGRFYSYIMNNYWMTNFKADQPGETTFRYVFHPFGDYDPTGSYRSALENLQPLAVGGHIPSQIDIPLPDNPRIVVEELRSGPEGLEMRLVNTGFHEESTELIREGVPVPVSSIEVLSRGKESCLSDRNINLAPAETVLICLNEEG